MSVADAYNFVMIDERLSTSGLINETQLMSLKSEGYQTLINLLPDEVDYAVADEASIVRGQGLEYIYIPVNFDTPQAKDYQRFEQCLLACRESKTIVHCAANFRVSAFYAIYAYHHEGWRQEQAYQHISGLWDLREHPVWAEFVAAQLAKKTKL